MIWKRYACLSDSYKGCYVFPPRCLHSLSPEASLLCCCMHSFVHPLMTCNCQHFVFIHILFRIPRFPLTFFVIWQDFWVSEKLNFIRSRGFYFTSTNCERSPNCGEIKVHEESCQIDFQTWETLIVCHVQITQEILKNCYDKNEAWTFLLSNRERARKIATQGCVFFIFIFSPDKKLKRARQLLQLTVNAAGFKCFGTPQFEC